ncbi:TRAP transporter small permease [Pseudoalteromonas tunicata]|jgi:TRAP-type C4-dicarboxylate transport system permease small subunit|uniref:TRAP transporter small permease protein n=1 Tax=Pseudoalteromonas tunicata D2 TaxID=87626 RepID=A4C8A5_9GAMM|nr:TRAP transporter small permease subunit [Pseudoalteromonas tunicata]ATC93325.1 hypothetical protein PTUN_a0547 [Pseudoalteromonas tunicata]AXT32376.1 TRAP transporter small permease subunit [Pseudoalteromonas tunicata]EAR28820.1 TRAP-type C4-dicarboxylate transport system, small permease component [Pseudoalteromonas tunicata D2]MDP4983059.1 TRAP transporter small permease subunit [Pseudoalteromonas tunicata]MDP5213504.1 TRAP transporter small permease subunit [Pseudoalteromonas tunicata]
MTKLSRLFIFLASACIALIFILVLLQITLRLFNIQLPSIEDFSGYLLITSCFLGLAYTFEQHGHIRVSLFLNLPYKKATQLLDSFAHLLGAVLSMFMVYACARLVIDSYLHHELTTGQIALSQWPLQLPMVLGSAMLCISIIKQLPKIWSQHG